VFGDELLKHAPLELPNMHVTLFMLAFWPGELLLAVDASPRYSSTEEVSADAGPGVADGNREEDWRLRRMKSQCWVLK